MGSYLSLEGEVARNTRVGCAPVSAMVTPSRTSGPTLPFKGRVAIVRIDGAC